MTQKVRSFALKSIKEGTTIRNLPEGNSSHRNLSGPLQLLSSLYKLELRGTILLWWDLLEVRSPSVQFPPNILSHMILYNSLESYVFKIKLSFPQILIWSLRTHFYQSSCNQLSCSSRQWRYCPEFGAFCCIPNRFSTLCSPFQEARCCRLSIPCSSTQHLNTFLPFTLSFCNSHQKSPQKDWVWNKWHREGGGENSWLKETDEKMERKNHTTIKTVKQKTIWGLQ